MHITFEELRQIKHMLPTGGVSKIAHDLNMDEQTVRNYFGAKKFIDGKIVDQHIQPGPQGGIVELDDTAILSKAQELINANAGTS
jgi:hypothetical protein